MSRRQEIMRARPKRPPLGTGQRFAQLKGELSRKGVRDPAALAASIGRKKFGNARYAELSRGDRRG